MLSNLCQWVRNECFTSLCLAELLHVLQKNKVLFTVCVCATVFGYKIPAFFHTAVRHQATCKSFYMALHWICPCSLTAYRPWLPDQLQNLMIAEISFWLTDVITVNMGVNKSGFAFSTLWSLWLMFSRGQLHQQCCEEWTLVSEETQAKMARMAAAAAWGLGNHSNT